MAASKGLPFLWKARRTAYASYSTSPTTFSTPTRRTRAGPNDGGSEKWGHYGREKGASDVVTQWPAVDTPVPDGEPAPFSGGKVFRGFGLLGAIGFAFDLQDDRSFDQTIEEGHRQRTVGEIFSPFIEVHVGNHRRGALLIARGDDLVKQVRRFRAFGALDFVKPEFIDN